MNRQKICLILLLSTMGTMFVSGQEKESLDFEKESWTIGISGLSDKGISKDSSYLLSSLPLLLVNELSDISSHELSELEKLRFSESCLKEKLQDLQEEKTALHSKRDELLFSGEDRRTREKEYRELSEQIEEKGKEISLFRQRASDEVQMKDSLPVEFRPLNAEESVLDHPRIRASGYMEREDLDFFITGSLEEIDNLYFISLKAFGRNDEKPQLSVERLAGKDELEEVMREAGLELRSLILGRPWSQLIIETLPDSAVISINGRTVGVGSARLKSLDPGFATLTVSENGYISDSRQIYLAPEGSQNLEVTLKKGEENGLYLVSEPPGADVYFGALWVGRTPLFTELPEERVQIKMSKEAYMPFFLSSDKISTETLTVELGTDLYEKELELKDAKSAFYRSLGWFSLSVGFPVVMAGIYQNLDNRYINYANAYSSTGSSDYYDKALDYKHQADAAYLAYWGGIALSGSLLVNVFFKLWNYIKAAEESTED